MIIKIPPVRNDPVVFFLNDPSRMVYCSTLKPLQQALKNGTITAAERSKKREEIIIKCMLEEFFDGMVIIDGKRK